jgi:putative effector of murein hydrolase
MKIKGRKATAWIIAIIWLSLFVLAIFLFKPESGWSTFFITVIGCFTLMTICYIGGTVWKDYIKSAHFRPELFDGDK